MAKILVGKTTEIIPGQMKKVSVDGNEIIVINIDGDCFALMIHALMQVEVFQKENLMVLQ